MGRQLRPAAFKHELDSLEIERGGCSHCSFTSCPLPNPSNPPILRAAARGRADAGLVRHDALGGDAQRAVGGLLHLLVQRSACAQGQG